MFQFKPYPIFVVYSKHGQEFAYDSASKFSYQGDSKMANWMNTTGKYLREVTEDTAPAYKHEALMYEKSVKELLDIIASNKVGKLLLSLLSPDVKIWIAPLLKKDADECGCLALTTPLNNVKSGGGVRVLYNPTDYASNADDILFHELVHAYRSSYGKSDTKSVTEEYPTLEEFLAIQMQNLYLSSRGDKNFYISYNRSVYGHKGRMGMKGSVYSHLTGRGDFIMALKHLLVHEYLAMRAAHENLSDYNPFRDYKVLERMCLDGMNEGNSSDSMIRTLPPF